MEWLNSSAAIIILIASLTTAVVTIFSNISLPFSWAKKKKDKAFREKVIKVLKEVLPTLLKEHDLEVRERYKADRQNYLNDIRDEVLSNIQGELDAVNNLEEQYCGLQQQYETLAISAKDVLREKIMALYHKNKHRRKLDENEKEALVQYYKDYKAINGNSYIDKYYGRMKNWEVVPEEYDEEE